MRMPGTFADFLTFLAPFTCIVAFVAMGIPALMLVAGLAAVYTGQEPLLAYIPALLAPAILVIAWRVRTKRPLSYAAQGSFAGSVVGVIGLMTLLFLKWW
jgi:hypothetical protein